MSTQTTTGNAIFFTADEAFNASAYLVTVDDENSIVEWHTPLTTEEVAAISQQRKAGPSTPNGANTIQRLG